ncbi:MAG: hypothetical protein IKU48_01400 [Clostridia bacterium]|nr:hypothetical protein [Clostridia bacterium]
MRSKCFKCEKAIKKSDHNYKFAKMAKLCGCFSCGAIFTPQEITEWYFYDDAKEDDYIKSIVFIDCFFSFYLI